VDGHHLSQTASGQPQNSPCVNAGSVNASEPGLNIYWTRTDQSPDTGQSDMGFHYGPQPQYTGVDPGSVTPSALRIYPLPAVSSVTVEHPGGPGTLSVYDLSGRLVTEKPFGRGWEHPASSVRPAGRGLHSGVPGRGGCTFTADGPAVRERSALSRDEGVFSDNPPGLTDRLKVARVGIAGCGGIGSNAAMLLARAGVGTLVIVDFDRVETRNLNRQHYFTGHIGMPKVMALKSQIEGIPAGTAVEALEVRIDRGNAASLFESCDLLIEALDLDESKEMLLNTWLEGMPGTPVVACSGLVRNRGLGFGQS